MAVDVGSAVGHLDLDISGFLANLKSAQSEADSASKSIASKIGTNFTSVGKTLTSVGTTLTKNVTVPIVGIGTAAVKVTSDFDSAMSKVSAISGATGKDFDNLRAKAIEMGAKTKFSATESAEAFTYMAMAGWDTEAMLEGIDGIMALSAADGLDLATTSDIVTDALTAFGMEAKDSAHFADVLAKASSSANTNVSLLGESFKYAAPVAGALGYTAEDVAVALGLMANAGIKGSQGGTALRSSLSRLIKPTDDAAAMMERYGLSLTNADGTMKPLGDVMNMLRDRLGGLSEAEQAQAAATLFGQEAMSGMLAIINTSDADYKKLTESVYSADGAAQQMADTMLNNLGGQLTLLKSALEGLAIQIGDIIMPYIMKFVEKLQELVQWFQNLDETQKENIIRFAAIAAAIGPVIIVIGKLFTAVGSIATGFSKLGTLMTSLKTGFSALGAAIGGISAPVLAIVAVIAVLIAAFVDLWKNNEDFRNKITAIWDEIKAKFEAFGQGIVDRLNALGFDFESFTDVLKALWKGLCDFLAPIFEGVFQYISDTLGTILDTMMGVLDFFIALFKGDWEGCWNAIKGIFETLWNGMLQWFQNILNTLKWVADVVLGWFGTSWDECWTAIKDFFVNIWNSITTFFTNVIEGIKNTAITVWNAISDFFTTIWTAIKNFFENIWNGISSFFTGIVNGIRDTAISVWTGISDFFTKTWTSIKTFFESIWNGITGFLSSAWETIKNVVQVGIMFIVELFETAFELITLPFRFIWENCKDTIISIWEAIKSAVSSVLNAIQTTITNVWTAVQNFFTTIWTAISTFVSNIWNTIKTNITTVINAISSTISSVWNSIKTTITNVINAISTTLSTVWNTIKTNITTAVNAISSTLSSVWNTIKTNITNVINSISSTLSSVWNTIKTNITNVINSISSTISSVWNSIKSTITNVINSISSSISSVFNSIKTTITNVFNSIKSTATTVWNGIKSAIETPINAAKSAVSTAVNSVSSTVSSVFNSVKSTVTSVWNSIKSAITTPINSARDAVKSAIDKMKSFFNFSWSLPTIKLPHFSISGKFSLDPPSIPHFSVSWYKKAMNNGMIMNGPTIFGFDSKTGKFLGGGEAGSETVVGTENLLQMIRSAVSSVMLVFVEKMTQYVDAIISTYSSANDRLYSAMERLIALSQQFAYAAENLGYVAYEGFSKGREAIERVRNNPNPNNNGGGDTFIFNSPKPIDEIEAAKQMKQTKRDLAEGF